MPEERGHRRAPSGLSEMVDEYDNGREDGMTRGINTNGTEIMTPPSSAGPTIASEATRYAASFPAYLTPLIGRERELADLTALVQQSDVRLISLTGTGGVGKTRLAVGLAESVKSTFPGGLWFVSLAGVRQPEFVLPTIAHAFGLPDIGDRLFSDLMRRALRGERALLVLDNFETVVEAAPLVSELLLSNHHLTIIVVSRVLLRLRGEHEYLVTPLQVPKATSLTAEVAITSDAIALYVSRARAVKPDFDLSDDNVDTIAEICRRLDGLPLAIELAAARTKVLPPSAMLTRMESRLRLLTGGMDDLPDRQKTMRDAIAWSHDLLSPEEQVLFRRLSCFSGGFTLEAAEAVAGNALPDPAEVVEGPELLDGLTSLLDKNLTYQDISGQVATHCRMLDTIREFGLNQLAESGEADAIFQRHAEWFQSSAEHAWHVMIRTPLTVENLDRIEADIDNYRSALLWFEQQGETHAWVRIAVCLSSFWYFRSLRGEGREWIRKCLLASEDPAFDQTLRAWVLGYSGFFAEEKPEAVELYEEAMTLFERLGDEFGKACSMIMLAEELTARGDHHRVAELCEHALPVMREHGQLEWYAYGLFELACAAAGIGDFQRSLVHAEESLQVARQIGDIFAVGHVMILQGLIAAELQQFDEAARCLQSGLDCWTQVGMKEGVASGLAAAVVLAVATGQFEEAARLDGCHRALAESVGFIPSLPERLWLERARHKLHERLPHDRLAEAEADGRARPTAEMIDLVAQLRPKQDDAVSNGKAADGSHLTARELEVLVLLVEGRTDREIAETLAISPNTATRHVANIFAKLDVTSRTAAATYAIRNGLA
jgi:predicted ATPase/DNA-binding CsgD family transcriptional regulator